MHLLRLCMKYLHYRKRKDRRYWQIKHGEPIDVSENQEINDMDYLESDLIESANDANSIFFDNLIIIANQSQMNINDPEFNIANFQIDKHDGKNLL